MVILPITFYQSFLKQEIIFYVVKLNNFSVCLLKFTVEAFEKYLSSVHKETTHALLSVFWLLIFSKRLCRKNYAAI